MKQGGDEVINVAKVLVYCVLPVPPSTSNGHNSACQDDSGAHPGISGITRYSFWPLSS